MEIDPKRFAEVDPARDSEVVDALHELAVAVAELQGRLTLLEDEVKGLRSDVQGQGD